MSSSLRFKFSKLAGTFATKVTSLGSGMGKSFPGWLFFKIGGYENLKNLSGQLKLGSVIVTGTNGKTTTTTMLIKLLSNDIPIHYSFESNTINAIATGLLKGKGDLGVFEYGIRDFKHGIPETVQRLVDPIGVVYTTISREHTQVAGVKNSFEDYLNAKAALSKGMERGIIVSNVDDPRTAYIAYNKEKDVHVNYYGLDVNIDDIFQDNDIKCPNCGNVLTYSKRFMNHRGIYSCDCGFNRKEPNVKITELNNDSNRLFITIEGNNVYNYPNKKNIDFKVETSIPSLGFHNLYNALASSTAYASFTPKIDNIENTIKSVFDSLDNTILPPGRFEVVKLNGDKYVGLGQGDNGDAVKANVLYMNSFVNGPLEFIYTTPDYGEDDIFNDHLESIRAVKPDYLIVVPGRTSIEAAEDYYNRIKDEFNCEFIPLPYEEMETRTTKLYELARDSDYKYVIMTGCGEEQVMWETTKQKLKNN